MGTLGYNPHSMNHDSHAITHLLLEWRSGNKDAAGRLMELVYRELHRMASREMRRERGEHTLQTTALVHEVYIRLCAARNAAGARLLLVFSIPTAPPGLSTNGC